VTITERKIMSTPSIPLPGEKHEEDTVIASVYVRDEEPPVTALLLLLTKQEPYYRLVDVEWEDGQWYTVTENLYPNIVPAAEAYADNGGDY
jgi:hypothetical protein